MNNIITSSNFHLHTRIGNKLFNYAFMLGCVKKYNREIILPSYFLFDSLQNPPIINNDSKGEITLHCRHDGFDPQYMDEFFEINKDNSIELNLSPFFQSQRWFEHCIPYIEEMLQFKPEVIQQVKDKYSNLFTKPTIGISLRLGTDFTGDSGFYKPSYKWYTDALQANFPFWRSKYQVVILSDNIELAKTIFKDYPFSYAEPNQTYILQYDENHYHSPKAIEQLVLGSLMDNMVISNSTFSWWISWLCKHRKDNKEGQIIHCGRNLANHYLEKTKNDYDYYPKDWTKF